MKGRSWLLAAAMATLSVASPFGTLVWAQEASGRFRVLVPVLFGEEGVDRRFGERFTQDLRRLINEMPTHRPIDDRELRAAFRQYNVRAEELTCPRTRQLGQLINAQLVFCGTYQRTTDGFRVEGEFWTSTAEVFPVEPVTVSAGAHREAAQHFYQALQVQSEQLRAARFCADYASSGLWEQALTACERAIELNPATVESRYTRAMVLRNMERQLEALEEFKRVLERDPLNEDAMQNAGYLSALLGREDDARMYYRQYLELNPTNAQVRMRIAYELGQAGDPFGAMQLIEAGLQLDSENVDLLVQHGGFAFSAAAKLAGEGENISVEAAELFRKALVSLNKVYSIRGAEMDVSLLRNMLAAHNRLQDFEETVKLGSRVLETHPNEPVIWSFYGDALQKLGRLDDALRALDRVLALDPNYPRAMERKAQWLFEGDRRDDGIAVLREGVQKRLVSADDAANRIFVNTYQKAIQPQQWGVAVNLLRQAKSFEISDLLRQQLDFWLGYALFQQARGEQEPMTIQTARSTLPKFQEVMRLMETCVAYARQNNLENNRQQIRDATQQFIEIQEAIIKRGGEVPSAA